MTMAVWAERLLDLGLAVRDHVTAYLSSGEGCPAEPVAVKGGDTIYELDRHVEPIIEQAIASWPDECLPLLLIAEGLGTDGRHRFGRPSSDLKFRLIVDPIDGTRMLMYGKRSGWFLAALMPDCGEDTTLADAVVSVLVELPSSKQGWSDAFVASTGQETQGYRFRVGSCERQPLPFCPSRSPTLKHGFAHVVSFFPGTKMLAADLLERIVTATLGAAPAGQAEVFDDQYLSSGGQMVELMMGRDRFCCDLRPLFHQFLARTNNQTVRGLECHPYDVAGALAVQQSGVILTDGFGRPLDCPLNVEHGVHWCGYANEAIQKAVQPVIQEWLAEHGLFPN